MKEDNEQAQAAFKAAWKKLLEEQAREEAEEQHRIERPLTKSAMERRSV